MVVLLLNCVSQNLKHSSVQKKVLYGTLDMPRATVLLLSIV